MKPGAGRKRGHHYPILQLMDARLRHNLHHLRSSNLPKQLTMASARQIRDEIMKMTIVVNSDPAQKEIYQLTTKTKELSEANKGLSESLREIEKERRKEETAINSYADKIDRLKFRLRENQSATIEQIKALKKQQDQYSESSKEFQNYQLRIDTLRAKSKANTNNLEASISSLVNKQKPLIESYDKNSQAAKKLTTEINGNKSAINEYKNKLKELNDGLNINQMTMAQLKKEAALLRTSLLNMVPGRQPARDMQAQLDRVNARMNEVRTGANQTSLSFRNLADKFNHYQGIALAATAVLVGFGVTIQSIIERNNKMADAMSGVEKTTGMARKEVEELTRSFSDFDTRTKKVDLLKIAEVGGRLGVAKEDIKSFTQEVDKANVALGDGFEGGVEQVTNTLGKLQGLYRETKDLNISTAINQIGSAMNELGAAGAASEANIGDFALRLGSLPDKLKPTIAESLALGAAFEESGIMAERSATAYASFIRTAAKDTDKFAKVMHLTKKEVDDMMNTDPLQFFLKFAEGAKGLDTTELAKMLDYLKLNDQYVISSLGAASENTDRFRKSIELSNKSLTEATSLQDEFNKVNNNAAAIYEKVQRKMAEAFTSKVIADFINDTVTAFGKFLGVVEDADGYITGFRASLVFLVKTITLVMVTMLSYNLLTGVYNGLMVTAYQRVIALTVVEKARNLVTGIATALTTAYRSALWLLAAGYSLVRGQTAQATMAMTAFNTSVRLNPIGLFITVLIAAVTAAQLFSKETNNAAKAQKNLNDITKEGVKDAAEQVGLLERLYKAATNAAHGKEAQLKAAKELIRLWPEQFKVGTEELIMNGKMASSYYDVRDAIIATSKAKAAQAEIDKINAEYLKKEEEIKQKMRDAYLKSKNAGGTQSVIAGPTGAVVVNNSSQDNKKIGEVRFKAETENLKQMYIERNRVLSPYINYVEAQNKKGFKTAPDDPTSSSNYSTPGEEDKDKKRAADKAKREADRLRREQDAYDRMIADWKAKGETAEQIARQIQLDIEDAKIEAMQEGYDKEIDALNLLELRKNAEIDKKKVGQSEFDKLDIAIKKAKDIDKKLFENLRASWISNNNELENLKLAQTAIFDNKRQTLRYKSEQKWLGEQEIAHQTALGRLKREQDEEIASYTTWQQLKEGLRGRMDEKERQKITNWAEGKEALTKVYQRRELQLQVTHLEAMVKLYEGLDLGILTPEQRKEVMKFIEDAGNKIAEFRAKIAGENQDDKKGPKKLTQKGSTDVLGMAAGDWDTMFTNLQNGTDMIGTMVAAVGALHNAFGAYYQYVEANEKRQLQQYEAANNRKKKSLKSQLDNGYINQETYKKLTIKADNDLEKRKAEIAVKQAKREKQMAIASTLINTAQAIMGIWAQFPKFDFGATAAIMSGVVGALGAIQIATIMSQPLPTAEGFEDGFGMEYPMTRAQDGKRFNVRRRPLRSGLVDRPTHFIAGENNNLEMVIDTPTWTSYSPQLKSAIYSANARAKGFETGFNTTQSSVNSSGNDEIMIKMMALMSKNIEVLEYIRDTPPVAIIQKNARNGKEIDEMQREYLDLKNKNKH